MQKNALPTPERRLNSPSVKRDMEKLLSLQSKDAQLAGVKAKLDSVPREIAEKRAGISAAEKECDAAKAELEEAEKLRGQMRSQRRELEEKVFKYKNQLLEVKKNDDYVAINAEIDRLVKRASEMEEEELETLFDIDSKREKLESVEAAAKRQIEAIEEEISAINAAKTSIEADFAEAKENVRAAREDVPPEFLAAYDKLKASKIAFPLAARVEGSLCTGCFLKVSGELLDALKNSDGPVFCEQCGRIIFL